MHVLRLTPISGSLLPSLHIVANLDQQLIKSLEADQAGARVLNVHYDVHDDDGNDRKTEDMQPTPVLAG